MLTLREGGVDPRPAGRTWVSGVALLVLPLRRVSGNANPESNTTFYLTHTYAILAQARIHTPYESC